MGRGIQGKSVYIDAVDGTDRIAGMSVNKPRDKSCVGGELTMHRGLESTASPSCGCVVVRQFFERMEPLRT